MGQFKERCEMIHQNLQEVSAFARELNDRKGGVTVGIELMDFARLIETIADELERAIDGQPLRAQDGYTEEKEPELFGTFKYGPGRFAFTPMEETEAVEA